MSFFKYFPIQSYNQTPFKQQSKFVIDILNSAKIKDIIPDRSSKLYVDYIIKDGEKPEHLAYKLYNDASLHWVILLSNSIMNPYFEWPLSTEELDNYIKKTYTGICLYYKCTDETRFLYKNSLTYLPTNKSNFINGNTITQQSGSGIIKSWNPTLRCLNVNEITSNYTFVPDVITISKNEDNTEFEATPLKVVYECADALHHFKDDFDNYIDPYGKINSTEYEDGKIYSRKNFFYENNSGIVPSQQINDFSLNRYISGNTQVNVVTNRQYENDKNDSKRKIKLLRLEYINKIVSDLSKLFNA